MLVAYAAHAPCFYGAAYIASKRMQIAAPARANVPTSEAANIQLCLDMRDPCTMLTNTWMLERLLLDLDQHCVRICPPSRFAGTDSSMNDIDRRSGKGCKINENEILFRATAICFGVIVPCLLVVFLFFSR